MDWIANYGMSFDHTIAKTLVSIWSHPHDPDVYIYKTLSNLAGLV